MQRVFAIVVGVAVFATASTMMKNRQPGVQPANVSRHADAAYRDGLFLGQFDAKQGREPHFAIGRWSSDAQRELFRAGYKAGYERAGSSTEASE